MNRRVAVASGLALLALGAVAAALLWTNRGAHLVLEGAILKVRTLALDSATAVVADFRLVNPADYPFVVRKVDLIMDVGGRQVEGVVAADVDARDLFAAYPIIGPKYNETLRMRETIPPKRSVDRMVAARFELSQAEVEARRGLRLRIEELDGLVSEIQEVKP